MIQRLIKKRLDVWDDGLIKIWKLTKTNGTMSLVQTTLEQTSLVQTTLEQTSLVRTAIVQMSLDQTNY